MLATVSDRKFGVSFPGSSLISYYDPHIVTAQDYYPFGMISRVALPNSNVPYRFGFNGKMNDNDVKGMGNQQDYGMRIYDARVGRFLSVDPLTKDYPWYSPYQFAGDNPIKFIDLDGLEPWDPNKYVNSDAPSVDPKYKNVNLHQPKPKLEGAVSIGWKIIKNATIAIFSLTEIPAAAEYGDKVKDKAKAFPVTHGSAKGIIVAPAAIAMELKKDPGNEDAWAQAALFAFPLAKGFGRYGKTTPLDPMTEYMSRPLTEPLPSLSGRSIDRKAYAAKIFSETGKAENDVSSLMGTIDFNKAVKPRTIGVGEKVYRFEKINGKGGGEMHFFTDAYGADAGPTAVGFSEASGYKLVTYEVLKATDVMESTIRYTKTKQYFSTELQNNVRKISEE